MENQRTLLYISLAMILFLLWSSWQQDYGPQPVQTQSSESASTDSSNIAMDVPGAAKPTSTNDMPVAEGMPSMSAIPEKAGQQRIHVVTDKLIVEIDTLGGDIKA
ncbi:MAG: membrane protein insertase YidC, partial [Gammaproteobacteria bacterium]|nr:membrane protein insertase YidC [Gammaproteobacteria bacterium]